MDSDLSVEIVTLSIIEGGVINPNETLHDSIHDFPYSLHPLSPNFRVFLFYVVRLLSLDSFELSKGDLKTRCADSSMQCPSMASQSHSARNQYDIKLQNDIP